LLVVAAVTLMWPDLRDMRTLAEGIPESSSMEDA
jgi:hypothetical protein